MKSKLIRQIMRIYAMKFNLYKIKELKNDSAQKVLKK